MCFFSPKDCPSSNTVDVYEYTSPVDGRRICYYRLATPIDFSTARTQCGTEIMREDAELAFIPEQEAQTFIEAVFASDLTDPSYVFPIYMFIPWARRGGVDLEVTSLTAGREIQVRFPAYPHRVSAL